MRVLSRADIQAAVAMREAIAAVREAFIALSTGQATVPVRVGIAVPPRATALFMPAYAGGGLGVKVVTVYPDNPARALPLLHALVVLLDAETGAPVAALEGGWLTALRTGAASGAATDLLARPDARTLAVFGAGAQAETQTLAVCAVRPIERVLVSSRTSARAEALAERLAGRYGVPTDMRVVADPAQAVAEADVICTATTSPTPVFPGAAVRQGAHINAVGAFTTTARELDTRLIQRSARLVVDERAAAEAEAGDLVIPWLAGDGPGPEGWTELGLIAAGRAAGRTEADQITLFKSVGNAAQDVAVGALALVRAAARGLGVEVEL
ncbi:MAG: ornithine cyclodeaminase [Anaerolineae bacterium]|nr:ornithine cyclodeaminase [Anaerolineae bacterium]